MPRPTASQSSRSSLRPRLGDGRESQAVPRGENLVVPERLRARVPELENVRTQPRIEDAAHDETLVLERLEQLRRNAGAVGLVPRPRVCQPLDPVGVGVLSRGEPAFGKQQLADEVVERLLHDLPIALVSRDDPRVQVRGSENGVVVQHLLEVRHEPAVVDRVAVEAAADDVVQPSRGHLVQGLRDDRERLLVAAAEEELERGRRRELRRAPETAVRRLERGSDPVCGVTQQGRGQRLGRGAGMGAGADRLVDASRLAHEVLAALAPGAWRRPAARRGSSAGRVEARAGSTFRRRRAARRASGRRSSAILPTPVMPTVASIVTASTSGRSSRSTFTFTNRSFISAAVEVVLEGLVRHHVAPVARAVADGDEERLVLGARALERLVPPFVPVDRVLRVLEEVRARRVGQAVHVLSLRTPLSAASPCEMIAGMKRNFRWLIVAGGVIVVLGVLWQAFSIAAYIRGAGDGALDAHVGGSFLVHLGQLAVVIGAVVAYWGNWRAVGLAALFLVISLVQVPLVGNTDEQGDWANGLHGAFALLILIAGLLYAQKAWRELQEAPPADAPGPA